MFIVKKIRLSEISDNRRSSVNTPLIIISFRFEKIFRMQTCRTFFGRSFSFVNEAAVPALPFNGLFAFEYHFIFYPSKQFAITPHGNSSTLAIILNAVAIFLNPSSELFPRNRHIEKTIRAFLLLLLPVSFELYCRPGPGRIVGSNHYHTTFKIIEKTVLHEPFLDLQFQEKFRKSVHNLLS